VVQITETVNIGTLSVEPVVAFIEKNLGKSRPVYFLPGIGQT